MQVVILCGGQGTRLRPKTEEIPKPLIPIGERPILWHLMKVYARHGHKDFILCLGHLGEMIREYFSKPENVEPGWNIEFADTGVGSTKAERLLKVRDLIKGENFLLAYGDDLSSVNINEIVDCHVKNNKIVTLMAINPVSQFGIIEIDGSDAVTNFKEKPKLSHWINAGYYVFNKRIFDYLQPDFELEKEPLEKLAAENQIVAFKFDGFFKTMNTLKDVLEFNNMWDSGELKEILYPNES
jgi:glucose-1-phosphate cytidylyltransferase